MSRRVVRPTDTICVGCGCTDHDPCEMGCGWLVIAPDAKRGVCSNCPDHVNRFSRGDREFTGEAQDIVRMRQQIEQAGT